jgi:hypothetical protein
MVFMVISFTRITELSRENYVCKRFFALNRGIKSVTSEIGSIMTLKNGRREGAYRCEFYILEESCLLG